MSQRTKNMLLVIVYVQVLLAATCLYINLMIAGLLLIDAGILLMIIIDSNEIGK